MDDLTNKDGLTSKGSRRLWVLPSIAVVTAITIATVTLYLGTKYLPVKDVELWFELAKMALDVAVATLLVGAGKWLIDRFQDRWEEEGLREQRQRAKAAEDAAKEHKEAEKQAAILNEQREFRMGVTAALGRFHADVYVVRRKLKIALAQPEGEGREYVDEALEKLMRARAEIGNLTHSLRSDHVERCDELFFHVRAVRSYLKQVIVAIVERRVRRERLYGDVIDGFIGANAKTLSTEQYRLGFKSPYLAAKKAVDPSWALTSDQEKDIKPALEAWKREVAKATDPVDDDEVTAVSS